jgi:hypothetical protein
MDALAQILILSLATVVAAGVAAGMVWVFLSGAFRLMQPAAVRPRRVGLGVGVRAVARGLAGR